MNTKKSVDPSFIILVIVFALAIGAAVMSLVKENNRNSAETAKEYERFMDAVNDGYAVHYNGYAASGDAIGITKNNINGYRIVIDNDKKCITVNDKWWTKGGDYYNYYYYN